MSRPRDEQRAEERRSRRERISAVLATVPGLDAEAVLTALTEAAADRGKALRELDEHLAVHPDALVSGDPRCPAAVIRLARALHAAGRTGVVPPGCAQCHRTEIELPCSGPDGRICQACSARDPRKRRPCARCGRTAKIAARREEGGICYSCYRTDPQVVEECAGCGRIRMPVTRRPDGGPLCGRCWTPPTHVCASCGRSGPATSRGPDGPLCEACYVRMARPRRLCGNCGRIQPISRRAIGESPDLCWSCAAPPEAEWSTCGRVRPCTRNAAGEPVCRACRPRATRPCAACQRDRRVHAHWPLGPVCGSCYTRILDHPGRCGACAQLRPLIGRYEDGRGICGPCSGRPEDYRCPGCGQFARVYAEGRCPRCILRRRLEAHLAGPDGQVSGQLRPLLEALAAAEDARGVLRWLQRSPNARLLGELAASGRAVGHDVLDELPPGRYEHYVRQTLVHTGVLTERHEDLDRIPAWLDRLLAGRPARHAALIRPYVHWHLLRRARRRAAQRARPAMAGAYLRTWIRIALELLTWLDEQHLVLGELTQDRLDQWLADGNTRHYTIRYFLAWAARRGLAPELTVPLIPRQDPARILEEDERWSQLSRLLGDTAVPLEVRAAGALVLLFGLPTSRIRHLRTDHLGEQDGQMHLAVGTPPLLVPPKLAVLLRELADAPTRQSRLNTDTSGPRWLFPGLLPGRPAAPSGFSRKLLEHGIDARPARNAALIALLEDVPPPILADLLGLHINTAVRWAEIAKRGWTDYLEARDDELARNRGPATASATAARARRTAAREDDPR